MYWMTALAGVGVGGAIGAMARYGVSMAVRTWTPLPGYAATLTVNVLGCLAIGMLLAWVESDRAAPHFHPILVVGLLGSFTTFSTFSIEIVSLLRDGRHVEAGGYVITSVLLGAAAAWLGLIAAERWMSA